MSIVDGFHLFNYTFNFFEGLSGKPRLALNSQSSCLNLLGTTVTDTDHHACLPACRGFWSGSDLIALGPELVALLSP